MLHISDVFVCFLEICISDYQIDSFILYICVIVYLCVVIDGISLNAIVLFVAANTLTNCCLRQQMHDPDL